VNIFSIQKEKSRRVILKFRKSNRLSGVQRGARRKEGLAAVAGPDGFPEDFIL